jgi:hypothetical protein
MSDLPMLCKHRTVRRDTDGVYVGPGCARGHNVRSLVGGPDFGWGLRCPCILTERSKNVAHCPSADMESKEDHFAEPLALAELRAIWIDGPDSEAARATRVRQAPDPVPTCRIVVDGCAPLPILHEEAIAIRDELDQWLQSLHRKDPAHTPAVRRLVAWVPETDGDVCWSAEEAYAAEAEARLRDCLRERGVEYWDWRSWIGDAGEHEENLIARWASLLRHRDEKAGCR